jgi:hypothetical protein
MGIPAEEKPNLSTGVNDVRHTPLGLLAQETKNADGMSRVLPGSSVQTVPVARFQSAI